MKNLLKVIICVIVFLSSIQAKAQVGIGAGAVYDTQKSGFGFSIYGKYDFAEKWSASPSLTLFPKQNYHSFEHGFSLRRYFMMDLDVNFNFMEEESVGVFYYGIGGLAITLVSDSYSYTDTDTDTDTDAKTKYHMNSGLNLGIGMGIMVSDKVIIAPEVKYTTAKDNGFFRFGLKLMVEIQ